MIAALFVATGGVYFGLEGVEPYDLKRNAFTYEGNASVVAHPPCERWGRYWSGGPSAKVRRVKGDDNGAFAFALATVRRVGGVLEHPEASAAWNAFGLFRPPKGGGWIVADLVGGWTCCVEQGHYGHPARKATWLYAKGVDLPSLKWGRSSACKRLDLGFHSSEERRYFQRSSLVKTPGDRARVKELQAEYEQKTGKAIWDRLTRTQRLATPLAFRDLLLQIASTARK